MAIKGIVEPNKRNGTKFGYPTANIVFADSSLEGLFVGYTRLISTTDGEVKEAFSGKKLPSLIFIGAPQMISGSESRLETHILDFPLIDLYGSEIEVEVLDKIRGNEKFETIDKMIQQMNKDEQKARDWFLAK